MKAGRPIVVVPDALSLGRYASGEWSIRDVAVHLGCSCGGARKVLLRAGLALRGPGDHARGTALVAPPGVCRRYEAGELSQRGVARELGCSQPCARDALRRAGVLLRHRRGPAAAPGRPAVTVPPALCEAYARGELSGTAVAARLGCTPATARAALRRAGVAVRPRGPRPKGSPPAAGAAPKADRRKGQRHPGRDAEVVALRRRGLLLREIGRRYGLTAERVRQILARAT